MKTIWTVDAFTSNPFSGNPAGVCVLDSPLETALMQSIAAEMNLSETAFLSPIAEGYHLRWFTPKVEVPLCGHATLASAHILWTEGIQPRSTELRFQTQSGVLRAKQLDGGIELDFPEIEKLPLGEIGDIEGAINAKVREISRYGIKLIAEVADEKTLRSLKPDFKAIMRLNAKGLIVTARSQSAQFDFVSRFFAPAFGIDEDPVTGSAHCALGPYWRDKLGKKVMRAYQASARGGEMTVTLRGGRVFLLGQAVTVIQGTMNILG